MANDLVIILAAGEGKRMKSALPKVLHPICGRPMVDVYKRQAKSYSEDVAAMIDAEVKKIMDEAYRRAERIIRENDEKMEAVVAVLLEKEKITGEEFSEIVGPRPE